MRDFITAHGIHHCAAGCICARQAPQVLIQVALHLAFGFSDEPQAGGIAKGCGERADGERAGVPQGIEEAGTGPQFPQASLTPAQVIGLFVGRIEE